VFINRILNKGETSIESNKVLKIFMVYFGKF